MESNDELLILKSKDYQGMPWTFASFVCTNSRVFLSQALEKRVGKTEATLEGVLDKAATSPNLLSFCSPVNCTRSTLQLQTAALK